MLVKRHTSRCDACPLTCAGIPKECDGYHCERITLEAKLPEAPSTRYWHRKVLALSDESSNYAYTAIKARQVVVGAIHQTVLPLVMRCPSRGGVLPLSQQPDCGCTGKELSACAAGKGDIPGRVTLSDCITCRTEWLATQ